MTIKVYIAPDVAGKKDNADGGIKRVVEAQDRYLPEFGITPVHEPREADIICNHGATLVEVPGVPSVQVGHGLYWSRQPWGDGFMDVNRLVVESMRHAVAHTAPSEWVSRAIRRGGYFYPEVVYHGVDADDFPAPAEFDPDAHALAIFENGRAALNDMECGEATEPVMGHCVGGWLQHSTITADDMVTRAIHMWPDVPGQKIQPAYSPPAELAVGNGS